MPLYEYRCAACGSTFEKIRKFSDPPLEVCEKCGKGPIEKLISSPAIQFKGTGWYITDYAKKSTGDGAATKAAADKSDREKKDAPVKTEAATTSDTSKTTKSDS
jgi:putative FmdB family regulatory protein